MNSTGSEVNPQEWDPVWRAVVIGLVYLKTQWDKFLELLMAELYTPYRDVTGNGSEALEMFFLKGSFTLLMQTVITQAQITEPK